MKTYTLLWILFILIIRSTIGQELNLDASCQIHVKNKRSDKVVNQLFDSLDYSFSYDASILRKRKVTLHNDNTTLRNILFDLFEDSTLSISVLKKQVLMYRSTVSSATTDPSTSYFKGKVLNALTYDPIPYVPIKILHSDQFTITSATGDFIIPVKDAPSQLTASFQSIGYETQLDTLPIHEQQVILLKPIARTLREVIIRRIIPDLAIKKSLNAIQEQFRNTPSVADCSFREAIYKNDQLVALTEASLELYKTPYQTEQPKPDVVKWKKGRRFISEEYTDTINFKVKGSLQSCLYLDVVKNLPDFYSDLGAADYNYYYADLMDYGESLVYQINFKPRAASDKFFKGSLYLDQKDLTLKSVAFEVEVGSNKRYRNTYILKKSKKLDVKPSKINYQVHYRMIEGKYYLSYILMETRFDISNKDTHSKNHFETQVELLVNGVRSMEGQKAPKKSDITRKILLEEPIEYSFNYWNESLFLPPDQRLFDAVNIE